LIIVNVPVPGLGAVWPAIVVGVTVFFLVIVASIDLLGVLCPVPIPASTREVRAPFTPQVFFVPLQLSTRTGVARLLGGDS
jgi:hypothetical protein